MKAFMIAWAGLQKYTSKKQPVPKIFFETG